MAGASQSEPRPAPAVCDQWRGSADASATAGTGSSSNKRDSAGANTRCVTVLPQHRCLAVCLNDRTTQCLHACTRVSGPEVATWFQLVAENRCQNYYWLTIDLVPVCRWLQRIYVRMHKPSYCESNRRTSQHRKRWSTPSNSQASRVRRL